MPTPSKRVQFQDESKQTYVNDKESYIEFSLELKESNITSYCKALRILYKTIKDINSTTLIIQYQPEEEEYGEITESNDARVVVKARGALLNYSEAIPDYL